MKKLFYLLAITLFVSSCSTTNFINKKKNFNGNQLTFGHKDVEKKEVKQVKQVNFLEKQDIKAINNVAVVAENNSDDVKPLKRIFKSAAKNLIKSDAVAAQTVNAEKVVGDFIIPAYEKASFSQGDYTKASSRRGPDKALLIVLAFFVPWIAVGLATDWDVMPIIYNLLWTILCGFPAIIHAIVVISRMR